MSRWFYVRDEPPVTGQVVRAIEDAREAALACLAGNRIIPGNKVDVCQHCGLLAFSDQGPGWFFPGCRRSVNPATCRQDFLGCANIGCVVEDAMRALCGEP